MNGLIEQWGYKAALSSSQNPITFYINYENANSYSPIIVGVGSGYANANNIVVKSTLSTTGFTCDSSNGSAHYNYSWYTRGY